MEASFRSCIPVTNSHFAAVIRFPSPQLRHLHIVNSDYVSTSQFSSGSVCKSLIGSRLSESQRLSYRFPYRSGNEPFRRWVFMNTFSRGRTGAAEDVERVSWLTVTPQPLVPTSFARLNRNPATRATLSIKRTVSPGSATSRTNITLIFGISIHYFDWDSITILEILSLAPIRTYTRHNGLQ